MLIFWALSLGLRLGPGPVRLTRARELKKIYSRADHPQQPISWKNQFDN